MWTPRRVLLLLAGLFGFGAAYLGYARFLGSVDGLPQLPEKCYPAPDDDDRPIYTPAESPTISRLKDAFGPDCAEQYKSAYPIQIELRDDGVVLACGSPPPLDQPTEFVKLSPFSMAVFGKPRPPHERLPGEVVEITTLHADEAILQLDRKVKDSKELLTGKARIVGMELRAAADNRFNPDKRAGRVLIRNNQRLPDPGRALEFRTPGPLFYRSTDHPDLTNPNAPHVWTAAPVEVVNRDNLPRPLRGTALPAAPFRLDDSPAKAAGSVSDMVLGQASPPPTVTAVGMKVYLRPTNTKTAKASQKTSSFNGVRELILSENVVFHLWTDGGGGFPGSTPADSEKKVVPVDPPLSLPALAGGLADGRGTADRLAGKTLVTVRTLGPFRYDWETNAARFDIAPQPAGVQSNTVELIRQSALGPQDFLSCDLLEIEFTGPLTAGANESPPRADKTKKAGGPGFKTLRATGAYVLLSASAEELQAQGTFLEYTTDPAKFSSRTVLRGQPVLVKKQNNQLMAGSPTLAGLLTIDTTDPPQPPGKPSARKQTITVVGPGGVDLYDEATKARTLFARWQSSLTQTRDKVGDIDADLLVFDGDGTFGDTKGDFHLTADTLRLWLQPQKKADGKAGQPLPARVQGVGRVRGKSSDAVIDNTDLLNVWFRDTPKSVRVVAQAPPAPPPAPAVTGAAPAGPATVPFLEPVATVPPKANPLHLSARSIEVTLSRFPGDPKTPKTPGPGGNGLQYEMHKAVCDGRVIVHQDPAEPHKNPKGTDIVGAMLHLDNEPAGYRMKVTGSADLKAEVHFEKIFIAGPVVLIDQPNNRVRVDGGGTLRMPAGGGLSGPPVKPGQAATLLVLWTELMEFYGEKRVARFVGTVQGTQQSPDGTDAAGVPTSHTAAVTCHLLDVTFDRPVYFNQMQRPNAPPGPKQDDPKVERVAATPIPDDAVPAGGSPQTSTVQFLDATTSKPTGRTVKAQHIDARGLRVDVSDERTVIDADGPGETRTLQLGAKDTQSGQPMQPADGKPAEQEMKLTAVSFQNRLRLTDMKDKFQTGRYLGPVKAVQLPCETLAFNLNATELPPRSVRIHCADVLEVSSYKEQPAGQPDRRMKADGQARVWTDDYIGDGHTIDYDGTWIVLSGYGDRPATMYRRDRSVEGQDYQKGNPIRYNTKTKQLQFERSSGGSFSSPGN